MIASPLRSARRGFKARLAGSWAFLCLALSGASPLSARTVPYLDKMADIHAAAAEQDISGPFSGVPAPGDEMLFLETPGAADHRVLIASHYCQAYQIDNPVSVLLKDIVAATNPLSAPETSQSSEPPIDLRVLSGSTVLRCMGKGDLGTICKNRVRLEAEVSFTRADGVISKTALVAEVERNGRVGGFCGHIARFTGIVTREAAIDLVRQARASAGEHRPI